MGGYSLRTLLGLEKKMRSKIEQIIEDWGHRPVQATKRVMELIAGKPKEISLVIADNFEVGTQLEFTDTDDLEITGLKIGGKEYKLKEKEKLLSTVRKANIDGAKIHAEKYNKLKEKEK